MNAVVHAADIQDRDGGPLVIETMHGLFPFVTKLFADGGYQGPQFRKALAKVMPQLSVEIVKRSDTAKGFSGSAAAMGRRTDLGLAKPLPSAGQGFREPQWSRPCIHQAGVDPPDAAETE